MSIPNKTFEQLTRDLESECSNVKLDFLYIEDQGMLAFLVTNTDTGMNLVRKVREEEFFDTQLSVTERFHSVFNSLIKSAGGKLK